MDLNKAWSHRRTDMYQRENGLKYADCRSNLSRSGCGALKLSIDRTSTGHVTGKTHVNRMYTG